MNAAVAAGLAVLVLLASVATFGPAASGAPAAGDSIRSGELGQPDAPSLAASPRATIDRAKQSDGARDLWVGPLLLVAGMASVVSVWWRSSADRSDARPGAGPVRVARPRGPPAVPFI